MAVNTAARRPNLTETIVRVSLPIITAGVIGLAAFAFDVASRVSMLETAQSYDSAAIHEIKVKLDRLDDKLDKIAQTISAK